MVARKISIHSGLHYQISAKIVTTKGFNCSVNPMLLKAFFNSLSLLLFFSTVAFSKERPKLYLAGDSTMAEKLPEKRPETGWGECLQQSFENLRVENHARNGRSTRTFIEERRWETIVNQLKEHDYVFIQFGHNDQSKEKADRFTTPEDFKKNLTRFVDEAREKKATPVLLTPVVRRRFDSKGSFYDVHGEYPDLVRAVAKEKNAPLIDMHRRTEELLKQYGVEKSKTLFLHLKPGEHPNYPDGVTDDTHFSPLGARVLASLVIEEIRTHNLSLTNHLTKEGTRR
jgi:lysophospholipase L1-like esterase